MARLIQVWRRAAIAVGIVSLSALALSACGDQSALALARQACSDVHASIASYEAGIHATNSPTADRDLRKANDDLQAAEPLAAAATSADGQWNALMTTLNEAGQIDEGHLIAALRGQCAVANGDPSELPNVPATFPSNVGTQPNGTGGSTTTNPGNPQSSTTAS